jgi:hypothetical protein
MAKPNLTLCLFFLCSLLTFSAGAQERVVVSHSVRGSLSIGPLLYGIHKGFYRNEGLDLLYVSIRADLGIKALVSGDVDFIYSAGTGIRAAVQGIPVKILSMDFTKVFHSLMARPEITTAAALKQESCRELVRSDDDLSARASLRALGLDPVRDVTILPLGGDTVRFAALQSGTVQAAMMSLPLNIQLKKLVIVNCFTQERFFRSRSPDWSHHEKIKTTRANSQSDAGFRRGMHAFKSERADFVSFAQRKFSRARTWPKKRMTIWSIVFLLMDSWKTRCSITRYRQQKKFSE